MMIELASIRRFAARYVGIPLLAAGAAMTAAPAAAQTRADVVPYLEVQQVLTAELDGGDVLTYTSIAAGVDARVTTRRVEAQISYRYEHRVAWDDDLADNSVHSGVAQARVELVPDMLSLDGGALAARSRTDGRGPVFGFNSVDHANISQVYSLYAGPTLSTQVGALSVGAAYRLGYVEVDDQRLRGFDLPAGQPRLDRYDSSVGHNLSGSIGMGPGRLPFGWTIGAGYVREDVDRLDQEYEGAYVRGDVVVPLSPTFAVTAGVGYEDIEQTQQDFRRDANGLPIVTPGGRLVADPSRPRLTAYSEDGVIWDAGFIWRPTRRTELEARVGRRYGGTSYTGSFRHQFDAGTAIRANVYDAVSSFGRQVVGDLASLPVDFRLNDDNPLNPGIGGIGGCVFGGEAGTGVCFDDAFQSINTANFRNRGVNLIFSGERGAVSFGLGAGYSNREYFAPRFVDSDFSLDGVVGESVTLAGNVGRELSRNSGVALDAFANWSDSGIIGSDTVFGTGVTASYYRRFLLDRLQFQAALGLYTTDSGLFDSTGASALVGLRYRF